MSTGQFVCAINRGRDGYQVPLALQEAGLLSAFVTDFYAPANPPRWLPAALRRRRAEGLPSSKVITSPASFLIQSAAQVSNIAMAPAFRTAHAMLGTKAAKIAAERHAHLYCYSSYMPQESEIPRHARRGIFEYHPISGLVGEILADDFARFPQVAFSYNEEIRHEAQVEDGDIWRRAEAISCASSFTKRSLVHVGCDPTIITVIPYGAEVSLATTEARSSQVGTERGPVEFLYVGQGIQRKGVHHLIEAWQACDLADARLTLVCYRIDPGIRDMIRSPSIRLLERQPVEALDELYRTADVFAMPSLVEGFGLVYQEALSRGCHVIGTQNTGLPDLDLPDEAATLVKAGDIEGISAALASSYMMAASGKLSRQRIAATAANWTWADFRQSIANHARSLLS